MTDTLPAFDAILGQCRLLFEAKNRDYGVSWCILRTPSLTDQIFIKAARIRSIQEKKAQKVSDGISEEYLGIINYCLMALIQLDEPIAYAHPIEATSVVEKSSAFTANSSTADLLKAYDHHISLNRSLLSDKNHDYGEAWRSMRDTSFTDLILMKLLRIKQIEDNGGQTSISEGVGPGYRDIINYSVFALIQLEPSTTVEGTRNII
ncbi:MAG: DUF1599 domain-containing protein [Sphingomonadales bacterium]|nr:DUF1599 domain-containing protein [Sphingomonadales bacterium]